MNNGKGINKKTKNWKGGKNAYPKNTNHEYACCKQKKMKKCHPLWEKIKFCEIELGYRSKARYVYYMTA